MNKLMSEGLFNDMLSVDSVLEDLAQGDTPTRNDINSAIKAFERIKRNTAPVLFTHDEIKLFLDAVDLYHRESFVGTRLDGVDLDDRDRMVRKLAMKMMAFIPTDIEILPASYHVQNALDLLHTIHMANQTKRATDILLATKRSLERALSG